MANEYITLDELNAALPNPPKSSKKDDYVTLDELNAMLPPPPKGMAWYKQLGKGLKAGTQETLAGTARVANKLGLFKMLPNGMPDWIVDELQQQAKNSSKDIDNIIDNSVAKDTAAITNFLTSAAITGGEGGILEKLTEKFGVKAAKQAMSLIQKSFAKKIAERAVKAIPQGAAFGAVTANPDESVATGATIGAVTAPIGSVGGDLLGEGIQQLTKYKKILEMSLASPATNEEIKQAIKSAKGATPLAGNALRNPSVSKTELNRLPTLLGFQTKARNKLANMGALLVNQANDLYSKLVLPIGKSERSDAIQEVMENNQQRLEKNNIENYKNLNTISNKLNVTISPENFYKTAQSLLNRFSQTQKLFGLSASKKELKNLKSITDTVKALSDYTGEKTKLGQDQSLNEIIKSLPDEQKDIVNKWINEREFMGYGKKKPQAEYIKNSPLDTANFTRSLLGDLAYTEKVKGNRRASSIYNSLYKEITKDIENGIQKTGSKELSDAYSNAQKFYKENIVPLMDKKVWGALNGKIDPDTIIKTFLPKGDNGRITLLSKLLKNAPGSEKLILSEALADSTGENLLGEEYVNPAKLRTALGKIGDDRLKMLIKDPEILTQVKDFLNNMVNADDTLSLMFNPKTGYANMANINFFETGKIAQKAIEDALKGNRMGLISTIATYAGKHAESRAINDPEVLNKILDIRDGNSVSKGMYKLGEISKQTGVPFAKLLTVVLNSNS